jgi:hypothetical protein
MNNQIAQIKTTLELPSIATAALVSTMSGRVFIKIDETDMVGGVNMGRLPCIYLSSVAVTYEFQAEPNHFGSRTTEYNMRIIVPTFLNRSEAQYLKLESIKQVALSELTKNLNLGITNIREEPPQVSQMATFMDIRFTSETSYVNDYKETT